MIKVSIIISTFNRDELLKRTLTSLRLQTFKDFEVLVCDDGGTTKKTQSIAESYKIYYPINYYWRENNEDYGLAATRNMGSRNAKGDFLFFLDGDMILLPETVEKMYKWLTFFPWRRDKYHVVPHLRKHVDGNISEDTILHNFDDIKNHIIKGFSKKYEGISPGGGGMISKKVFNLIGGFDDILFSNLVLEDIEFIYRLESFLGHKTKRLPFFMYHQDNRDIRSDREIKSRRNEELAWKVLKNKFEQMGFKFDGKRPSKDLKKFSNKHYKSLLENKSEIENISKKLKKEVIEKYNDTSSNKDLEHEYIANEDVSTPLTYIIILNYNGKKWLELCLPSVLNTKYPNFKILVVDNDSSDESVKYVKNNYPKVEILQLDNNYGYAGGNNKGIRYALKNKAEYIAVLNNDTTVDEHWLARLIEFGEGHFDAGAMGPLVLNHDGTKIQGPSLGFNKPTYLELETLTNKDPKSTNKLVGCAILFKKKALEKVGYFDSSFFCYQEEYDWCQRALYHNFNLYQVPSSRILHHGFKTSSNKKNFMYHRMRYLFTRNEIKRYLKDPSRPLRKLLKFVIFKNYSKNHKANGDFFIYYIALLHNIITLPLTIHKRNIHIKGY